MTTLNNEIANDLRDLRKLRNAHDYALGGNAKEKLKGIFERVERLEEQKADIQNDIKDIFEEAKGDGYDIKAIKHVMKMRKMKDSDRINFEAMVDTYEHALGMLDAEARG